MDIIFTKFKEEAKKFTILYINKEDSGLPFSFYSCFKEIYFTSTCENGIKLFDNNHIDIVLVGSPNCIHDPKHFVDVLRTKQYDIPIVSLSEKTDTNSLLAALDLHITKYIVKPIILENIVKKFYELILDINKKNNAKKQHKIIREKKLKSNIDKLTKELIISLPYPIAVFSNNIVMYKNKEFDKLLKYKKIDTNKTIDIQEVESIFENKKDFCTKISDLSEHKNFDKKFFYQYKGETKIFVATKEYIKSHTFAQKSFLVVFNNVYPLIAQTAMITYQKNKIQTYNELLEDVLTKKLFTSGEALTHIKTPDTDANILDTFDKNLNDKDIGVLRRSRENKHISSKDYLDSLDESTIQDIEDLHSTQEEILDLITIFGESADIQTMDKIINLLSSYATIINYLIEFGDLSNAITSLINFLSELNNDILQERKDEITIHLNNFVEDLGNWRKNIFFSQDTLDIHYLDSSLFSSSLQFQIMLSQDKESQLDDGELEFF